MDNPGRAARFRERAKEIRSSTATIKSEGARKDLMRLVDYYEQMAGTYDDLAKPKTSK